MIFPILHSIFCLDESHIVIIGCRRAATSCTNLVVAALNGHASGVVAHIEFVDGHRGPEVRAHIAHVLTVHLAEEGAACNEKMRALEIITVLYLRPEAQ